MTVQAKAVAVSSTASFVVTLPPGPSTVIVSNASGHTVFLGDSNRVTITNGFPLVSGSPPLPIPGFVGSASSPLWAITQTSAVTLGLVVSTTH